MQPENPFQLYECPNPLHFYELGKRWAFGYQVARSYWAQPGAEDSMGRIFIEAKRVYSKAHPERVQFNLILGKLAFTVAYLKKQAPSPQ